MTNRAREIIVRQGRKRKKRVKRSQLEREGEREKKKRKKTTSMRKQKEGAPTLVSYFKYTVLE
jgi:hypothetical protein